MTIRTLATIVVCAGALGGCAAVPLTGAALGSGALSAGAGAAVRAGTEYTRSGVAYRTFSLSLSELRLALGDALARMEIAVITDETEGDERRMLARAGDRDIDIRLEPLTRKVTQLRLEVAAGMFRKDRATASEIVVQIECAVDPRASAACDVRRAGRGSAASSLARGARR
jgi:hypothetical protein